MKKPIILEEGPDAVTNYYGHNYIGWGFCTRPDKNNVSTIVSELAYCRESLTNDMYEHMESKGRSYRGIDHNRLRLIARIILTDSHSANAKMRQVEQFFEGLEVGIKMLNIMEERHRWSLTKLYDTQHKIHKNLVTKMLIGSSRWMKSPHMLSLFCLIIRVAVQDRRWFPAKKVSDFKSVDKLMRAYGENRRTSDKRYIYKSWPYVDKLMATYNIFFKHTDLKRNWSTRVNRNYYNEGIDRLLGECSSGDRLLNRRAFELRKKADESQK
jgi:hypothetical protein